jgi:putative transposase
MAIEKDLLDRLLADYKKPEDLIGETGLLKQLTKALLERALEAELTDHLGHEKHAPVVTELNNRGVQDIFIACVDGLKGFPEAIETVFPHTQVQLCLVHMVRHSLKYVSWKQRKEVAADLKTIYQAATAEQAEMNLAEFEAKWDKTHPSIGQSWRRNWERIIPFFAYPAEIRKVIYTTNAIESLNMSLRKVTKNRGSFPNDAAMFKLLYLALNNIAKKWSRPVKDWKAALNRFSILYEARMPEF